jgi:hypothetical protein
MSLDAGKYILNVTQKEGSKYKFNMTMNISLPRTRRILGQYKCVASNFFWPASISADAMRHLRS